jgi:energy-coupling factor transport system ATP-binding protein
VNPQELSRGERKRLLLAVTEAIDAPIWVMDEPFDDLDESWRAFLMQAIGQYEEDHPPLRIRYLEIFVGTFDAYGHLGGGG